MFLHIGGDVVVSLQQVTAILDLRTVAERPATRDFLQLSRSEKKTVDISAGEAKSAILTKTAVYLSPISSMTLKRRGESAQYLNMACADDL